MNAGNAAGAKGHRFEIVNKFIGSHLVLRHLLQIKLAISLTDACQKTIVKGISIGILFQPTPLPRSLTAKPLPYHMPKGIQNSQNYSAWPRSPQPTQNTAATIHLLSAISTAPTSLVQ